MVNMRHNSCQEKPTIDEIFSQNLLKQAWGYNIEIHQIFIDFQTAPLIAYEEINFIK